MAFRTIKHFAGEYERTDGLRSVRVSYMEHLRGWIAAAEWDRDILTDPLPTKKLAISNADCMLGRTT